MAYCMEYLISLVGSLITTLSSMEVLNGVSVLDLMIGGFIVLFVVALLLGGRSENMK